MVDVSNEWLTRSLHRIIFDGVLSFMLAVAGGVWLFIITQHRHLWLRYTAASAIFWKRLGILPSRLIEACQQFEERRAFVYFVSFLVTFFLFASIVFAGLYIAYRHTFNGSNI
jgi:hypothetical protein